MRFHEECGQPRGKELSVSHSRAEGAAMADALLHVEQTLPLCLCPFAAHSPPVYGAWTQKRGLALLIREALVSRKWLLLLTSAELGFPGVLWRQEVSNALLCAQSGG